MVLLSTNNKFVGVIEHVTESLHKAGVVLWL